MAYSRYYIIAKSKALLILGNKCSQCDSTEELEIDHKYGYVRSDGPRGGYQLWVAIIQGRVDITRLQLLCKLCHKLKSAKETRSRAILRRERIERITETKTKQSVNQSLKIFRRLLKTVKPDTAVKMIQEIVK